MLSKSDGQAVIESIIAISTVLIVLVILLPILSKFIESKQATEQAARYMAWERTVWFEGAPSGAGNAAVKSNADLQREIHWRFFSSDNTRLSSDDRSTQKNWTVAGNLNPALGTRQTHNAGIGIVSIMERTSNNNNDSLVSASVTNAEAPGFGGTLNNILSAIDFGGFSVSQRGLYGSRVAYTVSELPGIEPFDEAMNITPTSEVFIQGDGWNTAGKSHTETMVRGLTPSSILDFGFMNTVRNVLGVLPFAKEIRTSSLKFGHVDTEQLPDQRLCKLRGNRCQRGRRR